MRMTIPTSKITLLLALVLIISVSGTASVDSMSLDANNDRITVPGTVEITGDVSGSSLSSVKIQSRTSGDWDTVGKVKGCFGSECSISRSYSTSSSKEVEFRLVAAAAGVQSQKKGGTVKFVSPSDPEIDSVDISIDSDNIVVPGTVVISGETTGEQLNSMKVERKTGSGWDAVGTVKGCSGDSCSISRSYSASYSGEEEFRVKVAASDGSTKVSSTRPVEFESSGGVDEVSISTDSDRIKVPGTVLVSGDVSGSSLSSVKIQSRTSGSWNTVGTVKGCSGNSCSISRSYSTSQTGEVEFRVVAAAGDNKRREETNVDFYEIKDNQKPEIDLISPRNSIDDLRPEYRWLIDDNQREMESVTFRLDDDSNLDFNPIQEVKLSGNDLDTGFERSLDHKYFWSDLERGETYYWGLEVDDGDNEVSEKARFSVEEEDDDYDRDYEDPDADLEVSPYRSETGETVTFDASDSTDNNQIDRYEFDFDNDGYYEETDYGDGVVYEEFSEPYSGDAVVKVYDEAGNSDKADDYYVVEEKDDDDEYNGRITVAVEDSYGNNLDATVEVDGESKRTYSDGRVVFRDLERTYQDVDVSKSGYYSESKNVNLRDYRGRSVDFELEKKPSEKCGVSQRDLSFSVSDSTVNEGKSVTLELRASNMGDSNQRVGVRFEMGSQRFDEQTKTVPSDGARTFTKEVTPGSDTFVRADVSTKGDPCGSKSFQKLNRQIVVLQDEEPVDEDPEADFSYTPSNPDEGERVSFDAGSSSDDGSIVSYSWNFGEGTTNAGREVTHTFDSPGSYPVTLTVEDDAGQTDSYRRYVTVGQVQQECGISQQDLSFSLEDYTITEGDSTEASVQIFNTGSENQRTSVRFKLGGDVVGEETVTVPAFGSRTVEQEVSPDSDTFVRAQVSTEGDPCGSRTFSQLNRQLVVLQETDEDASLDVTVENENGNPVRNAEISAEGPEDRTRFTDSQGEAGFSLATGDYDITATHPDYRVEQQSVTLYEGESEDIEFELERRRDTEDGTLEVTVRDEDGDWVEEARVEVENGEDRAEYTDSYGFADFRLEEDRYDITVTHPDYRGTRTGSVYIEEGETERRTFRLSSDRGDGLEITSVDYPDSVCRGDTLSVDYSIRNTESFDESATTVADGFRSRIVTNRYEVDPGDTVSGTLRFTNVQGSGAEDFTIQVQNGTTDSTTRTVTVEDCAPSEPVEQDPSAISMKLSYPISPNKALVGDTVKVSGFVDGVSGRSQVSIDVNNEQKAQVSTQPDGYYQTFIRADSVGTKTVTATSGGRRASRTLEVLPTAKVGYVNAPRQVFEGETFEVCSNIESQVDAKIRLIKNNEVVQAANDRGEVCFEVEASQPGSHVYKITAITLGEASTVETSVRVLETDVEATSFPDQVASVESGDGIVKVDLYNTHNELKRYNLELSGLPSTWLSQSRKEVVLDSGERETVYFYLTPRDDGTYDPEIIVQADNQDVYRQEVDLEVGGQNEPRKKSLSQRLTSFLPF